MKNSLTVFLPLLLIVALFIASCDTATDSKATQITPPSLTAPPDRDTTVGVLPTFQWTGTADRLQVDNSEQFTTPIEYDVTVSGQSHTSTHAFTSGTWYWWHVGVTSGGTVYWSTKVWSFRVQ